MIKQFQCKKPLELLGKEDIKAIHDRSLRILHEIGVIIEDEGVLSLLADHGCTVDMKQKQVWMEADLVEKALKTCPSEFTLKSRDGANDLLFDRDTVRFGPCSGMQVVDIATGRLRPGTVADAQKTLKLTDALDIMAGANAGLGFLSDRPTEINLVWYYSLCIKNSSKVFCLGAMEDSVKWGIEMAQLVGQDVLIPASSITLSQNLCMLEFSGSSLSLSQVVTSGCSGGIAMKVQPKIVSGLVVKTFISLSEFSNLNQISVPKLLPIQLVCIVLTRSGQSITPLKSSSSSA